MKRILKNPAEYRIPDYPYIQKSGDSTQLANNRTLVNASGDTNIQVKYIRFFHNGKQGDFWGNSDMGDDISENGAWLVLGFYVKDVASKDLAYLIKPGFMKPHTNSLEEANDFNKRIPYTISSDWDNTNPQFVLDLGVKDIDDFENWTIWMINSGNVGCMVLSNLYKSSSSVHMLQLRFEIDRFLSGFGYRSCWFKPLNDGDFDPLPICLDSDTTARIYEIKLLAFSCGTMDLEITNIEV